jgi:hypothetical protein
MKKTLITFLSASFFICSCGGNDISIGNDMFVHDHKVFKIIDNELREIGDLNSSEIKKFEVSKPVQRDLGIQQVGNLKAGASVGLKTLYRGNFLYYTLKIEGLNDLRENFNLGTINIEFVDEYGFILHSTAIAITDLVGEIDNNGKVMYFTYNGKTEMSTDISVAIKGYAVASTISHK